jgi:hypothetical protein
MAHYEVCIIGGGVAAMFYLATYKPVGGVQGDLADRLKKKCKSSPLPVGAAAADRRKLRAPSAQPAVRWPARSGIGERTVSPLQPA